MRATDDANSPQLFRDPGLCSLIRGFGEQYRSLVPIANTLETLQRMHGYFSRDVIRPLFDSGRLIDSPHVYKGGKRFYQAFGKPFEEYDWKDQSRVTSASSTVLDIEFRL